MTPQSQRHHEYFRERLAQERDAADRSVDPVVRRIHEEMARRYESAITPPA